jgi:hypothetical protein
MKEPTFSEMLTFVESKQITRLETPDIIYLDLPWTLQTYKDTVNERISNGFKSNDCDICKKVKANLKEIYNFIKEKNENS